MTTNNELRVLADAELALVTGGTSTTGRPILPLPPIQGGPIHEPVVPILPAPAVTHVPFALPL
jgi:hypothetical protein